MAKKSENGVVKRRPQVNVSKSVFYRAAVHKFFKIFSYVLITVIAIYVCFAATIIRFLPTDNFDDLKNLFVPVKNQTFEGGHIPVGKQVVVNLVEKQGKSTFDRLKQAFWINKDVAVVEVHAGPVGRITWAETGLITVDGKPMGVTLETAPEGEYLNNEYLVACISGACNVGEGMIISAENVYGEPLIFRSVDETFNSTVDKVNEIRETESPSPAADDPIAVDQPVEPVDGNGEVVGSDSLLNDPTTEPIDDTTNDGEDE